jgi:hypothetical protein
MIRFNADVGGMNDEIGELNAKLVGIDDKVGGLND